VGGLSNLLKEMRQFNKLETQLSEQEQNVVQLENWNAVLTQQIEELQGQQQDKEEAISELKQHQKEIKKEIQSTAASNEKMLREQLKIATKELE